MLSVDDAHLLDDASLLVLQHVVRNRLTRVICTARPGWSMESLTVVPVDSLAQDRADALLTAALGGPADASTRHLVWANSQGNPLYLKELVAEGLHSGALTEREGGWNWSGPLELSGRLAELVDMTLGRLADPQRRALELLAYGEPLEPELMPPPQDLVDMGFVRVGDDGRARVAHPLYSARLRATCPTLRARAHRRALADRLEATGAARPGDAVRVATWRLDSGTAESPDVLARAAEQALAAQDWELAERLSRAAVARGATSRVGLVLGLVLMYQRQCAQAEEVLADTMAAGGDMLTLIQVGCTRAFNLFFGLGDEEAAVAVMDEVTAAELPPELEHGVLYISLTFALEAAPLRVARLGGELLIADGGWAATAGRQVLAFADQFAGRYPEALARIDANHEAVLATAGRFPSLMNAANGVRNENILRSGDLTGAETRAAQALAEVIEEDRWSVTQVPPRVLLSQSARLRGQAASAVRITAEGIPESTVAADDVGRAAAGRVRRRRRAAGPVRPRGTGAGPRRGRTATGVAHHAVRRRCRALVGARRRGTRQRGDAGRSGQRRRRTGTWRALRGDRVAARRGTVRRGHLASAVGAREVAQGPADHRVRLTRTGARVA